MPIEGSAVLTHVNDRFDFKAAAKNIMDTRFKVYRRSEVTGEDLLFYSYRMGVTFTVAATYKFF